MDLLGASYSYGTSPLGPESRKQPQHIYLFGQNISYSLSPSVNAAIFKSSSTPWIYSIHETTNPQEFLTILHAPDTIGASITIPNKVSFMPLLDALTPSAQAIGAVNTVFIRLDAHTRRRRYIGTNTDCIGIRDALLPHLPCPLPTPQSPSQSQSQQRPALVIGAGGAARSAIYALHTYFAAPQIYMVNRLASEVAALTASLATSMPGVRLRHIATLEDAEALEQPPGIVVGTVPDAEPSGEGEVEAWRVCEALLNKRHLAERRQAGQGLETQEQEQEQGAVLDMCYHPPRTRLLQTAEAVGGWRTVSGVEVLLAVNFAQQALWTEREITAEERRGARTAAAQTLVGTETGARVSGEKEAKL